MTVANFDLNYLSYFLMNFKNSCAYLVGHPVYNIIYHTNVYSIGIS